MKQIIVSILLVWCCLIGVANTTASSKFTLDLCTGWRTTDGQEDICFGNSWVGDKDSTVEIVVNGKTLVKGLTSEGTMPWKALGTGVYRFEHITYGSDGKTRTSSATFEFTVKDFMEGDVSSLGYCDIYDGNPHSIQVDVPNEATVTYSLTKNGEYTSLNPVFVGPVNQRVWYRVEQYGYNPIVGYVDVVILDRKTDGVSHYWLDQYQTIMSSASGSYKDAVKVLAANGENTVAQCFMAGLDPTNEVSKFISSIEIIDGKPIISWTPDLNKGGTKVERTYTVQQLIDGEWKDVEVDENARGAEILTSDTNKVGVWLYRVKVALPNQ